MFPVYFSRNQFTHLPSFLCQLTSLEVLIVSNNRLVSIPEEIGQLTNLMEMVSSYTHTLHLFSSLVYIYIQQFSSSDVSGSFLCLVHVSVLSILCLAHMFMMGVLCLVHMSMVSCLCSTRVSVRSILCAAVLLYSVGVLYCNNNNNNNKIQHKKVDQLYTMLFRTSCSSLIINVYRMEKRQIIL